MNRARIVFRVLLLWSLLLGQSASGQQSSDQYRKTAEQGDPQAQNSLANCYYNGTGVARDYAEAVKWYRKAAAQGFAKSQFNLGNCYRDGTGVAKNYADALRLYRLAAEQGNAKAQHCIALSYDKGPWSVTIDFAEAARWYRKAAEQGFDMAQWSLGNCYQLGEGVPMDIDEAIKWFRLAAEQGNASAKKSLIQLTGSSASAKPATKEASAIVQVVTPPQHDEYPPYVLPVAATDPIDPGSGWGLGLATDPAPLLDALGGNRDAADVTAMTVLLRQAGGPLSEPEDAALNKQWAPYAASPSPKAHKAIRRQSELLLQSMTWRQMMMEAAKEHAAAISQKQIAVLMKDEDEVAVADAIADIQRQVIENAQKNLESLNKDSEAAPQIPTPEELKAEDNARRKNAEVVLVSLKSTTIPEPVVTKPGRVLLGYLKLVSSSAAVKEFAKANPSVGTAVIKGNSVSFTKVIEWLNNSKDIWKYECTWQPPGMIPVYSGTEDDDTFRFQITVKDTGSRLANNSTRILGVSVTTGRFQQNLEVKVPGGSAASIQQLPLASQWGDGNRKIINDQVIVIDALAVWQAVIRYKFEAKVEGTAEQEPVAQPRDPVLSSDKNDAIAEHQSTLASTRRMLQRVRDEMARENDPKRLEVLRFQALHLEQNIHDNQDLVESIRTGTLVRTRGPWDEHATAVMAQASLKMADDFRRAHQMQASYVRMLKTLEKHNPAEANRLRDNFSSQMIKGIYEPGGFDRARKALDTLHGTASRASQNAQNRNWADLEVRKAELARVERNLAIAESVKRNCDRAVFAGTLFTGAGAGMALSMVYEGSCVAAEKGPREAINSMVVQGGIMLGTMGVMKAGGWAIGKLMNPKVVQSEANLFKKILEANQYQQEMEWNRALVGKLKDKATAFEKAKAAGGKNYLQVRAELDDAVSAVNSSSLAKNIMKNEAAVAEKTLAGTGSKQAAAALNEVNSYQSIYNTRLQNSIYPRTDAQMVNALKKQGYNVEPIWFREFRNATSTGINRDRDLGLIKQFEGQLTRNGKPVPLREFMRDGQKAYETGYKQVTGRSATLADQNITTSAHSESFPVKWLEAKLGTAGDPADYGKAGNAIYNKVRNAMAGPDPAFVNLKKACGSLGKDLKTKVLPRLNTTGAGSAISDTSRKAAAEHWKDVQKVMDDFATDKIDPLTASKKLQALTGSTSITESAAEVQWLMIRLGGGSR